MELLSVNVGLPREVSWNGQRVLTGIFKEPVPDPVRARATNLDGDGQADPSVHGGPWKAVYAYPSEHYAYWREELPEADFPRGAFGENLTTVGLDESVRIGDVLDIGSARFAVTEPRLPCAKLALRFRLSDMPKRFLKSRRTGFYMRVVREGEVAAGDPIELVERGTDELTVADIVAFFAGERDDPLLLRRGMVARALRPKWRERFADRLRALEDEGGG